MNEEELAGWAGILDRGQRHRGEKQHRVLCVQGELGRKYNTKRRRREELRDHPMDGASKGF